MAPDRATATGLGATWYDTFAPPCPERLPFIDIHDGCPVMAHVQSRAAVMVIEPLPPAAPNEVGDPVADT
jgi:hypothetical protein